MSEPVVSLKTSLSPVTTIELHSSDVTEVENYLKHLIQDAPDLMSGLPCVLNADSLSEGSQNLVDVVNRIRSSGVSLVGLKNAPLEWSENLHNLKLANFGSGKAPKAKPNIATPSQQEDLPAAQTEKPAPMAEVRDSTANQVCYPTKIIRENIRSGRNFYFEGNLVIQGMVSAGAEVLAKGSIQIFGALRGKAIAGIEGDTNATISCTRFNAEMVSIASRYLLFDEPQYTDQSVLILLEDNELIVHGSSL